MTLAITIALCLAAAPAGSGDVRSSLGVNIHFTGAPARDLDMIRDAGFGWIRMDFAWSSVEREKGVYRFRPYDELVDGLEARSIRALFILDYSNSLYEKKRSVTTAEGRAAFARFAAAAAERYRGRGVRWEVWNEPNLEQFWSPQPAADDYAALVIETAKAIRAVDPEAVILAPASSGFPWSFLERIFELGVLEHIDEVSVHPYRGSAPETARADYARLRELIARHVPAGRTPPPIVSGEWGYSTYHHGGLPLSAETQARYLARELLTNLAESIPLSIWYDWANDGPDPRETEHNFGTVTLDRKPKPAYEAMQTLHRLLGAGRFQRRIDIAADDHLLLFQVGGGSVLAAWTTGEPHAVTLQAAAAPESLAVAGYRGEESKLALAGGAYDLPLEDAPRYVSLSFDPATLALHGLDVEPLGGGRIAFTATRAGPGTMAGRIEIEAGGRRASREVQIEDGRPASGIETFALSGGSFKVSARLEAKESGRRLATWPARRFAEVSAFAGPSSESPFEHLSAVLDGDAAVAGEARLSKAEGGAAGDPAAAAQPTLRLDYRFGAGWRFVRVAPSRDLEIEGRPAALSVMVRGDGSGNSLRCRFRDVKGETFQPTAGAITWTGWKRVEMPLDGRGAGHWGGDGKVDYPIAWDSLFLVDSTREARSGSIDLRAPVIVYPLE